MQHSMGKLGEKREPTEWEGLPFPATIQSTQEVGNSARQRFFQNVGIQHAKLVTDGADRSTATVPRGSKFSYRSFCVRRLGSVAHIPEMRQDERCSPTARCQDRNGRRRIRRPSGGASWVDRRVIDIPSRRCRIGTGKSRYVGVLPSRKITLSSLISCRHFSQFRGAGELGGLGFRGIS